MDLFLCVFIHGLCSGQNFILFLTREQNLEFLLKFLPSGIFILCQISCQSNSVIKHIVRCTVSVKPAANKSFVCLGISRNNLSLQQQTASFMLCLLDLAFHKIICISSKQHYSCSMCLINRAMKNKVYHIPQSFHSCWHVA